MNPELVLRREVAQRVAKRLSQHPTITSMIVFGSVATGAVDIHSDVDLLALCQPDLIPASERAPMLMELGSGWSIVGRTDNALFASGDEDGVVDGILVTVHYQMVAWIDAVLHEVIDQGAITTELLLFRPYTLPALLQRGWLLYDNDQHVARWREQIKHYPPLLKHNIVQHFTPILQEQTDELVATAHRGIGPRSFLFHLNRSVDALTSILYALNDLYDPADRRAEQTVWPLLKDVPVHFVDRLTAILQGPFDREGMEQCARQYQALAQDVLGRARSFESR